MSSRRRPPSSIGLSPADQAFIDILDDKVNPCLKAAEESASRKGCGGGVMYAVRAIANTPNPLHPLYEEVRRFNKQCYRRLSFWQDLVGDYDRARENLRALESEGAPYFTSAKIAAALRIMGQFQSIAQDIASAFDRASVFDTQLAHSFLQVWRDAAAEIRRLQRQHQISTDDYADSSDEDYYARQRRLSPGISSDEDRIERRTTSYRGERVVVTTYRSFQDD